MTDFNVQVRVRSGRLLRRIREKFGTSAAASRASGVPASIIAAFLTMNRSPTVVDGSFSEPAQNLASALGCDPEDIWPAHMAAFVMRKAHAEIELAAADLHGMIDGPEVGMMQRQMIDVWARSLSPRQMRVVQLRRSGASTGDLAMAMGVTRERITQIEKKALDRMRSAAAKHRITSYIDTIT
jgi:lambda repressor-like predicted transcriptional regulator